MGSVKDMVGELVEIAAGNTYEIRPTISGEQWTIHNLYIKPGDSVEVRKATPTDTGVLFQPTTFGLYGQFNFHCREDLYLTVKNVSATAIKFSFDGVVSRTA